MTFDLLASLGVALAATSAVMYFLVVWVPMRLARGRERVQGVLR